MINKYNIKTMYSIQGKSLREIARETGHTFRTVKKHALTEDFSDKIIRRPGVSSLDPFKEIINQVIADCYERKSLIITTNIEFSKWNGIFMDKKITTAILDRVIHYGHLVIFSGESYRLKNAISRKNGGAL